MPRRGRHSVNFNLWIKGVFGRTVRAVDVRMQKQSTTFQQIADVEIVKGIVTNMQKLTLMQAPDERVTFEIT